MLTEEEAEFVACEPVFALIELSAAVGYTTGFRIMAMSM
jgi:hypothetical protein